jgi:hypothetical protein
MNTECSSVYGLGIEDGRASLNKKTFFICPRDAFGNILSSHYFEEVDRFSEFRYLHNYFNLRVVYPLKIQTQLLKGFFTIEPSWTMALLRFPTLPL